MTPFLSAEYRNGRVRIGGKTYAAGAYRRTESIRHIQSIKQPQGHAHGAFLRLLFS